MALGAIGALLLAGVVVFFTRSTPPPLPAQAALPGGTQAKLENALRAGNPEFDNYKSKLMLENEETYAAQNIIGLTQFTVHATLLLRKQ